MHKPYVKIKGKSIPKQSLEGFNQHHSEVVIRFTRFTAFDLLLCLSCAIYLLFKSNFEAKRL